MKDVNLASSFSMFGKWNGSKWLAFVLDTDGKIVSAVSHSVYKYVLGTAQSSFSNKETFSTGPNS